MYYVIFTDVSVEYVVFLQQSYETIKTTTSFRSCWCRIVTLFLQFGPLLLHCSCNSAHYCYIVPAVRPTIVTLFLQFGPLLLHCSCSSAYYCYIAPAVRPTIVTVPLQFGPLLLLCSCSSAHYCYIAPTVRPTIVTLFLQFGPLLLHCSCSSAHYFQYRILNTGCFQISFNPKPSVQTSRM